ncbi:MAG: nitroreductase [Mycobacterium sp.]|jgi:deazaflavin-dependent oxidoreductase (nitroreductase family)
MGIAPETWSPSLLRLIRTSNRYLLNPMMLHLAGKRCWYASVIEHTGRQSGKRYATPIVADRVGEDLIVPLPYGTRVDWVRNVLAAGGATVVRKGETFTTQSPSIIAGHEALPLLPKHRRRSFERFGIGRFLRLRISNSG